MVVYTLPVGLPAGLPLRSAGDLPIEVPTGGVEVGLNLWGLIDIGDPGLGVLTGPIELTTDLSR